MTSLAALDAMMAADDAGGADDDGAGSFNGAWSVAESVRSSDHGFPVALLDSPAQPDADDPVLDASTVPAESDAPRPETRLEGTEHDYQLRLFSLIGLGQHDKLRQVVKVGADVNLPDGSGRPPLLFAVQQGRADCVEVLLELGADVNGKDRLGNTALHVAARDASADMTLMLLRSGAGTEAQVDVDAQSFAGRTPLHLAAAAGCMPVVEMLCEAGCTLDTEVVAPGTEDHDKTAQQLAEARSQKVGDAHDDCADEIGRVRRLRGTLVEPEEPPEIQQMRAGLSNLTHRVKQLEDAIKVKEAEIKEDVQRSQEYVESSEKIATDLGAATTTEELERLSSESSRIVELAASTASNITLRKAEAAGLRAELAETNKDAVDSIRAIADLEARAKLGHQTRVAEHRIVQKDMETRLLDLQIKQLKRELSRHVKQNSELRGYISDGHAKFLHKSAAERAELEAEYEVTMARLAELEGAMPRALDRTDMYETRVSKLRTQLAEVNATVATALQAGAEGETRAAMAEENTMQIQREMVEADKATRFARTEKKMAEAAQEDAELASAQAAERAENARKELTKVRTMARNTENRLKMAEGHIKKLKEDTKKLASAELRMQRAEKAAKAENKRAEGLRKERNSFERRLQEADERIRELEGTFNGGQADWWQKKLAASEKWTKRRERFYETNEPVVQIGDKKELDQQWGAINEMTRAVDVSLRRTCGQLKLRTVSVQTDTTWYPGRDEIEGKVRAIPMAALDSEGERHAWEELVRVKELEREATHDKCLQHEKTIREQVVLLRNLQTSESRLKNFKKTFGSRMEVDKKRIYELEEVIRDLNRMVNDPNPALKGVHEVLEASERAHEESKQLADKSLEVAKVAAKIPVQRPPTPPSLKTLDFRFQNTGRKVGIVWGKRERHGVVEVVVERVEENGQALRHGVPEGFVLSRVRHSKGEPDISKLKFSAIISVLEAGLQYSPLVVTLSEPAADETLAAQNDFVQANKQQAEDAEAQAKAAADKEKKEKQKQSKAIVPVPIANAPKASASAHATRGVPKLPSIAGPHGRQNILRQLAYAANEQTKFEEEEEDSQEASSSSSSSDEDGEGADGGGGGSRPSSSRAGGKRAAGPGSRPSSRSGSRPNSSSSSRAEKKKKKKKQQLKNAEEQKKKKDNSVSDASQTEPTPEPTPEPEPGAEGGSGDNKAIVPVPEAEAEPEPEGGGDGSKALAKTTTASGKKQQPQEKGKKTKTSKKKKKSAKSGALAVSGAQHASSSSSASSPSVEDNQYAITALSKSEEARQREAKRNVELQQRLEKMSIDLVVNAELVSTLQEELVRAETLAAQELHTVAEEQRRQEAVTKRNAVAAGMLRTVCELSSKLIDDLQTLNRDQLQAADSSSSKYTRTNLGDQHQQPQEGVGVPPPVSSSRSVVSVSVSDQEVADYAVIKLGMDARALQGMEWLAKAALSVTLADGWRVSRQQQPQGGGGAASKRIMINRGGSNRGGATAAAGRGAAAARAMQQQQQQQGSSSGGSGKAAPLVYLNDKDGRVMEKHPMEQKCQQIHLNLLRWAGLRTQAMAVVETPATALVAVPPADDDDDDDDDTDDTDAEPSEEEQQQQQVVVAEEEEE
jgi:hypothetical protein